MFLNETHVHILVFLCNDIQFFITRAILSASDWLS